MIGLNHLARGLPLVELNGKYGFINTKGDIAIPIVYSNAFSFSEGLARASLGSTWGFIDTTGKVVISMIYLGASDFKNGFALVYLSSTPVGYIDEKGTQYWEN